MGLPDAQLWLPAAVYRIVADERFGPIDVVHLQAVFDDFPTDAIADIVDALVAYGAVTRTDDGDLTVVPIGDEA